MFSISGAEELYNAIKEIVTNVKNTHIPWHWLDLTGPLLFYRYAYNKNISLEHITNIPKNQVILRNTKEVFLNTNYCGYIKEPFQHYSNPSFYYHINYRKIDDKIIQVYPHSFSDIFEFEFIKLDNNDNKLLLIKRTDINEGWGLDLKIKINEKTYYIGPSKYVYFILPI